MDSNIVRLGRIPVQSLILDILAFGHDELELLYIALFQSSKRFRQLLLQKYSLVRARLRDFVTGIELDKDPIISSKIEDMYSCAHELFKLMNIPYRSQRRVKLHISSSNFSLEEWNKIASLLNDVIKTNRLRLHELILTMTDDHIKKGCNSTLMSFASYQIHILYIHQVTLMIMSINQPIPKTFTVPPSRNLSVIIKGLNATSKFSPLKAQHISVEFLKGDLSSFLDSVHPTKSFLIHQSMHHTAKELIQLLTEKSICFKKQWGRHIRKFIMVLSNKQVNEELVEEAKEYNIIVITKVIEKEVKEQLWKWYRIKMQKKIVSEDIQIQQASSKIMIINLPPHIQNDEIVKHLNGFCEQERSCDLVEDIPHKHTHKYILNADFVDCES